MADYLCNQYLLGRSGSYGKKYTKQKFETCHSLYSRNLFGHYGCVNAIDFSKDGELLASGSDDRRVLIWTCADIVHNETMKPVIMEQEHLSNIFCTSFDLTKQWVFSAGNDEHLLQHDVARGELVKKFYFEEPVYGIDVSPESPNLFATASEDGTVQICDVRSTDVRTTLAMSAGSFHGVTFNPVDPRLLATANSHDGVALWDIRHPASVLIRYRREKRKLGAMSVRFNYSGRKIFALQRKKGPVIYDIDKPKAGLEFNQYGYKNTCTMKSACFAGDSDQYIASGSDDFSIYIWKIPEDLEKESHLLESAFMILNGHRSIVNQLRYNRHNQMIASGGVEKMIKIWSPFHICNCEGDITSDKTFTKRKPYTHSQYTQLVAETGLMTHDYGTESTEEDMRMIAFFDSLIERTENDSSSDESDEEHLTHVENILDVLLETHENSRREQILSSETESSRTPTNAHEDMNYDVDTAFGVSIEELRRLFRCTTNRTLVENTNEDSSISEGAFRRKTNITIQRDYPNDPQRKSVLNIELIDPKTSIEGETKTDSPGDISVSVKDVFTTHTSTTSLTDISSIQSTEEQSSSSGLTRKLRSGNKKNGECSDDNTDWSQSNIVPHSVSSESIILNSEQNISSEDDSETTSTRFKKTNSSKRSTRNYRKPKRK